MFIVQVSLSRARTYAVVLIFHSNRRLLDLPTNN